MENKPIDVVEMPLNDATIPQQPINGQSSGLSPKKDRLAFFRKHPVMAVFGIIVIVLILLGLGSFVWYRHALSAVGGSKSNRVKFTISLGSTPTSIGDKLEKDKIIRSSFAFSLYTRLSRTQDQLQAGTYHLSPGDTTQEIVQHLVKGSVDQFEITFLPGATVAENRQVLINAGYTAKEVDTALAASYSSPLFANKPSGTTLEGYIYGETYNFNSGATVEDILNRTFTQFESVIKANDLVSGFAKQGLTLYQGITLASIIQREVHDAADQKQVAQVFYSRLALNMPLGSDVTYIYAAKILGVTAVPTLVSPYNTRINTGLPPGPIAVPGLGALQATAAPASGSYLYFLSGDDGKTYFATTDAEHESNITNYCKVKCSD